MLGALARATRRVRPSDEEAKAPPVPKPYVAAPLNGRSARPSGGSGDCPPDSPLASDGDHEAAAEAANAQIQLEFQKCLQRVSDIQPWEGELWEMEKTLQDAVRNHGRVDLMRSIKQGCMVAVKRMPNRWVTTSPEEFTEKYPRSSERPWFDIALVRYLHEQKFPYICEPFGVFSDGTLTFVVNALATEGDLFSWCDRLEGYGKERETSMRPVVRQMLSAVAWLHDLGIAHRDLSLENVLLTREGGSTELRVKLIDFGMGTLQRISRNEVRGKQSYQAPEMHVCEEYDAFLSDAFALGVVVFCLASQDYPWQSTQPGRCQLFEYVTLRGFRQFLERRKLRKGRHGERLAEVFSEPFTALVEGLLQLQPRARLTLGERCWKRHKGEVKTSVWELVWLDQWDG